MTKRLPSIDPTTTAAWNSLELHYAEMAELSLQQLFREDPERAERMGISWKTFYFDYSKHHITDKTMGLLIDLAEEVRLKEAIALQFKGAPINETEDRAVQHTALRDLANMNPEIRSVLQKMETFSNDLISGDKKGYTGKPITDIVNVGIGGSDLGPQMVIEALDYYRNDIRVHFISNVDGDPLERLLKKLNPETTLFIIVSKSFSTTETLTNASTIKDWFLSEASETAMNDHFVAVTANTDRALEFGIREEHVFPMWDGVGGRFSLWSAVGLSICCSIGYSHFEALLKGAHDMDHHFRSASFNSNIPVIAGLLTVWYTNFFQSETEVVIPYSQYLSKLVPYLQQAFMESNGKSTSREDKRITYQTCPVIWGNTGTNAQHAFFQLLHQSNHIVPAEFIAFQKSLYGNDKHQKILLANCLAQSEALLEGTLNASPDNIHREFRGNKPSSTLLIQSLTPENLGRLIALYEHKVFVQGIVWNIYSFDQWGVELGKQLAGETLAYLKGADVPKKVNASTKNLLDRMDGRE